MSLQPFESKSFAVDQVYILSGSYNPSVSGAIAPSGSIFMQDDGRVWNKRSSNSFDWYTQSDFIITQVNSNYTVLKGNRHIFFNRNGASRTLTLYTAIGNSGNKLDITLTDTSRFVLTIQPFGSEKISGNTNLTLDVPYTNITLKSDGSNWYII